jgi:single-strand DNA-binding protein
MNRIILVGRLGRDPEVKFLESGTAICTFSIATDYKPKNKDPETTWHRIIVWDKQGEACGQYLNKGKQVAVEGRVQLRKYQDKNGNDRQSYEVVAQHVEFLGSKSGGQQNQTTASAQPAANQGSADSMPW